jgi:hypothetical protein
MHRIEKLLHLVSKDNTDKDLKAFYIHPERRMAMAGYRRLYNLGDCLLRIFTTDNIDMGNFPTMEGTYFYDTKSFLTERPGLPGRDLPDSSREIVDADLSDFRFSEVQNDIANSSEYERFRVLLNPKTICRFIESRTLHQGFDERKINMEVFDGMNIWGKMPGTGGTAPNGDPAIIVRLPHPHMPGQYEDMYAMVTEDSHIPPERIRNGKLYAVKPMKWVPNPDGVSVTHHFRVMGEYKPGIRLAIQVIPSGTKMPDDPPYNTYPETGNNISEADILEMPFIEGQMVEGKKGQFYRSPPLHFDLDTLYRALKPMEMFRVVEMNYKDSVTGVYLRSLETVNGMNIEAIIGPTSPFRNGMVCTK